MKSKIIGLFGLALSMVLSGAPIAQSANINVTAMACQASPTDAPKVFPSGFGSLSSANTFETKLYCDVPRSPLVAGAPGLFFVDGDNAPGRTTSCTLYVFDFNGTMRVSSTVTTTQTVYDLPFSVPGNVLMSWDYVTMLCTIPGNLGGALRGITSVQ